MIGKLSTKRTSLNTSAEQKWTGSDHAGSNICDRHDDSIKKGFNRSMELLVSAAGGLI